MEALPRLDAERAVNTANEALTGGHIHQVRAGRKRTAPIRSRMATLLSRRSSGFPLCAKNVPALCTLWPSNYHSRLSNSSSRPKPRQLRRSNRRKSSRRLLLPIPSSRSANASSKKLPR